MLADAHLIIHNVVATISILVLFGVIAVLFFKGITKIINATLALTCLAFVIFLASHIIGVSVTDATLSHNVLMWNLSVIFICMFNFHCVMAALHEDKKNRWMIIFVYAVGIGLTVYYLIVPDAFILASVPKMYFPNYYVPGQFHWVMRVIFQIIIPFYFIFKLAKAYRQGETLMEKNRILYFTISLGLGWLFGLIPDFLIYDIPLDPMYGIGSAILFLIPFTYAIVRYELLDIKVVAKKAFLYGVSIMGVGFAIALLDFTNQWLQIVYPGFPIWAIPAVSAITIVAVAGMVWKQLREGEVLKYEFVTTVTHKFRTPLTHIKWATENLKQANVNDEAKEQIGYIEGANSKLVELTDLLANASETDNNLYHYHLEKTDLATSTEEVLAGINDHVSSKKIILTKEMAVPTYAIFDGARLKFVLQTLIENALNYTPGGGTVNISIHNQGNQVIFSVRDSGIGIPKNELALMFTKLYRGHRARSVDTEGMGIGLYISKGIMSRHHGKIWAESAGENKGATLSFSLPAAR